jgi:hypothetical protein
VLEIRDGNGADNRNPAGADKASALEPSGPGSPYHSHPPRAEDALREILANVPAERCVWIDRLIASVSSTIPEIVNMQDTEFNRVLNEFEKLIATLDDISHAEKRSKTIH